MRRCNHKVHGYLAKTVYRMFNVLQNKGELVKKYVIGFLQAVAEINNQADSVVIKVFTRSISLKE